MGTKIPSNLKEVGYLEVYYSSNREINPIYIDEVAEELTFYWQLDSGDIVVYPSACRISDFCFTWSGCHYWYDTKTKRHYYVNPAYDGVTFYLYSDSVTELLELIRQFIEPSDELSEILEKTEESKRHFAEAKEIYEKAEKDNINES